MPDMNGIELLRALREDERFQSLPVILFSARTEETRGSEIGLGANDYLTKPFSAKELLSRVRTQILLHEIRNKALHQVTLANKELEAFSYSVSHDLRAPLRHIASFSQILIEDYADKLDDQGRDYIKRVLASTIRMSRLIDDLLNLSRITRHNISNNKVDLSALARKITEDYKANNPSSALEANIEEGIVVQGDAGLLEIVLDNLFGNALKFSSTRPRPKVSFGSKVKNGITYYFIKDNGVGFDMAYKNKLFGTFERLHSQEQFPGNGIGLATVQRIIQRHGGHIFAESKVEEGATFYFSIIPSDQA
jgi:light-regulated signal transduction histidine kinase (bacteriophytochrome)